MLACTSSKVAECLDKADKARRKASSASQPDDREFWHEMELKWVRLADSYEQVDRAVEFLGPATR